MMFSREELDLLKMYSKERILDIEHLLALEDEENEPALRRELANVKSIVEKINNIDVN